MQTYSVDLRVYEPANMGEIPFMLPPHLYNGNTLRTGYQNMNVTWSSGTWDEFCEWVKNNQVVMKIIGSEVYKKDQL